MTILVISVSRSKIVTYPLFPLAFSYDNFTDQYVDKSIVNGKVLTSKNLAMVLALQTAQFLSRNGQETGMRFYCAIPSGDVDLWTELITKKDF